LKNSQLCYLKNFLRCCLYCYDVDRRLVDGCRPGRVLVYIYHCFFSQLTFYFCYFCFSRYCCLLNYKRVQQVSLVRTICLLLFDAIHATIRSDRSSYISMDLCCSGHFSPIWMAILKNGLFEAFLEVAAFVYVSLAIRYSPLHYRSLKNKFNE